VLEDVAIAQSGGGPAQLAVEHEDDAARCDRVKDEAPVGGRQPQPLDPEVGHSPDHEAVLVRVVHVVQHELGVRGQQRFCGLPAGGHVLRRLVRMNPVLADGQQGLWQPGDAERGSQMNGGSVR
jgi:hypothetical protein